VTLALPVLLLITFTFLTFAQDCRQDQTHRQQTQRQKPAISTAPRDIAPRNLPAVNSDEAKRARDAAKVIEEAPHGMISDAKAIAVIPGVKKAAFIFGGRWGRGLMTRRDDAGNWIPPSFIQIGGGSVGLQAGIQDTDLVLIFTNEDAINGLLRGKLTLNAEASGAAGPIGRQVQGGVPISMNSGILSYSHNKGVFAGISLDGSTITIDDTSNQRVYGKHISGDEILIDRMVENNEVVDPFLQALAKESGTTVTSD